MIPSKALLCIAAFATAGQIFVHKLRKRGRRKVPEVARIISCRPAIGTIQELIDHPQMRIRRTYKAGLLIKGGGGVRVDVVLPEGAPEWS